MKQMPPITVFKAFQKTLRILACTSICALTFTTQGYADDEGPAWYQVELMLFVREPGFDQTSEDWRDKYDLLYPGDLVVLRPYRKPEPEPELEPLFSDYSGNSSTTSENKIYTDNDTSEFPELQYDPILRKYAGIGELLLIDGFEADPDSFLAKAQHDNEAKQPLMDIKSDPYILLRAEDLELKSQAQHLSNAIDLRLLAHLGWRQPADTQALSSPVLLQAGSRFDLSYELEGIFTFSKDRFLHINVDLFFSQFSESTKASTLDWTKFSTIVDTTSELSLTLPPGNEYLGLGNNARYNRMMTARLKQKRRLKTSELHYFDHPLFGLLVKVSPYEVPDPVMDMKYFDLNRLPAKRALPATQIQPAPVFEGLIESTNPKAG